MSLFAVYGAFDGESKFGEILVAFELIFSEIPAPALLDGCFPSTDRHVGEVKGNRDVQIGERDIQVGASAALESWVRPVMASETKSARPDGPQTYWTFIPAW